MSAIINIFAVPFGYVMRFIYQFVGNYGLSIILFSLLAKLIMIPVSVKQKRTMMKTQSIQPKIQQLQKQYGKDQERLNRELQELYEREGASPTAGCGTTLITFPIMLGLYYVISQPLTYFMRLTTESIERIAALLNFKLDTGYGAQVPLAGEIFSHFDRLVGEFPSLIRVDYNFLGVNLAATPSIKEFSILWLIPLISGLTALLMAWVQQRQQKKANPQSGKDAMASASLMTMLMMPVMSLIFGFMLPAGLGLYWIANNVFSALQEFILSQYFLSKKEKDGAR